MKTELVLIYCHWTEALATDTVRGKGYWGGGGACLPLLKLVVEFPYDPVVTTVILNVAPDIRVTWLHG